MFFYQKRCAGKDKIATFASEKMRHHFSEHILIDIDYKAQEMHQNPYILFYLFLFRFLY